MLGPAAQVGLHDHERFLKRYPPFRTLDTPTLDRLVRALQVVYRPCGSAFDVTGGLFVIRRGAVDLNGEHYAQGDTLGGGVRVGTAQATTDAWLYVLPPERAGEWLNHPALHAFLSAQLSERLSAPDLGADTGADLGRVPVSEIMQPPVLVPPDASVQEAATRMRDRRVSSLMIDLQGTHGPGQYGIITDKDLRNRVLAGGLPPTTPVCEVMSAPARTAPEDITAVSALNLMFRHNVRHLPLVRGAELVGMLGTADLLRLQTRGLGFVVPDLLDAPDAGTLVRLARSLPARAAHLYRSGQKAEAIARQVSYAYDALYRRALELTQAELRGEWGAAPGPFAWVLLGSLARRESGLNPDQDHHLLIQSPEHRPYFQALARGVEALLARAGLPPCDGGVLASNHLWTREEYAAQLRAWFRVPDPQALLNVTIYFDPRVVAGDLDVSEGLRVRLSARREPAFMGHLTRLAVSQRPPLGFLGRLHTGQDHALDLKVQGLARIIDLARLQALHAGEAGASTFVRLGPGSGAGFLHPDTRADLLGAYAYLLDLRLAHQTAQLERGETPGNRVPLADLGGPQEVHLREVFKLIGRVQATLAAQTGGPL